MAIAITEDHLALGETVADLARKRELLEANHALLEADEEAMPAVWNEIAGLGWLATLPLLSLPLALKLIQRFHHEAPGPIFNDILAATAGLQLFFAILLTLSFTF